MQTAQGSMLVSLRGVEAFLEQNAAALADVVNTGARKKLTDAIAALSTYTSDQTGNVLVSKGSTKNQRSLRQALMRDHMAPIARIAKGELPQTPQIEPLRMPRGRPTSPKLAAAADGMAKAAAPYASVFTDAGRPVDFIARLNKATEALLVSLGEHANLRGNRKVATAGVKAKLSAGRHSVRVIDAYVQSALKDDPILLAGWNSVRRVQLTGLRSQGSPAVAPAPSPVPAPAPASTTG
jgi:hypothetical protein